MFHTLKASLQACFKPSLLLGYVRALFFLQVPLDCHIPSHDGHEPMGCRVHGLVHVRLAAGWGLAALDFCRSHPEAAWDILVFCVCGAVGQNFIFFTINTFGALVNTTITTTRKFMSILVSALWTGSSLTVQQWGGVGLVFCGLSFQIFLKWQKSAQKRKATVLTKDGVKQPKQATFSMNGMGTTSTNEKKMD